MTPSGNRCSGAKGSMSIYFFGHFGRGADRIKRNAGQEGDERRTAAAQAMRGG